MQRVLKKQLRAYKKDKLGRTPKICGWTIVGGIVMSVASDETTQNKNKKNGNDYKRIVIDVDGTLCAEKDYKTHYSQAKPNSDVVEQLIKYKKRGFYIIIYSSRQMRTYDSNLGKIIAETVPLLIEWLKKYNIPYDELYVGKPWCGFEGFYVDDKAIRPDEFLKMTYDDIKNLLRTKKRETS
jgi:capsule biosynthesis phosphatase